MNGMSKDELLELASIIYSIVEPVRSDDRAILAMAEEFTKQALRGYDDRRHMMAALMGGLVQCVDGQITVVGLTRWVESAFPQVQLTHKYAAALMVSGVTEEVLARVQSPWSAFILEVPDKLLSLYDNKTDAFTEIRRILVTRLQHKDGSIRWGYLAMTDSPLSVWRFGVTTEDLLPANLGEGAFRGGSEEFEVTPQDERVMTLIGRLIINACLAMSDPSAVKKVGPGHKAFAKATREGRAGEEPAVRTFLLSKPVKLDCRPAIKEYVEAPAGSKRTLTVQSLVRGHFKGQWFGPGNGQYKVIWREPHYRGPLDAPIALRSHHLSDDKKVS